MSRPRSNLAVSTLLLGSLACTSAVTPAPPEPTPAEPVPTDPKPAPGSPPSDPAKSPEAAKVADEAARLLTGRFDSTDQSLRDTSYFAITLAVCAAEAPSFGTRTLYVEQARKGSAPYRQRLYVVEPIDDKTVRSRVFTLKEPSRAVGACDGATPMTFEASDVEERAGCEVVLTRLADRFRGHTPDARWDGADFAPDKSAKKCESSLNGASYATSEVDLLEDRMVSWDRGFDDAGAQVWGATKGGYEFVRRTPAP